VELVSPDPDQVSDHIPALMDLYANAYDGPPWAGNPFYSTDRYVERLTETITMDGFGMVNAVVDDRLIGTAYGVTLPPATAWWSGLAPILPSYLSAAAAEGRILWLRQMLVHTGWRGRGVGRTLHNHLVSGRGEDFVTLTVVTNNEPARTAYVNWGYEVISEIQLAPESPPYHAMIRQRLAGKPPHH
jgi:GNAT superfamily N-acetyltransferase